MAMPVTNVVSGARAVFSVAPKNQAPITVAYASGVNGSEEIQYEPVEVLNELEVKEWVPLAYRVTLSASVFRTFTDTAQTNSRAGLGSFRVQGMFPKNTNSILSFQEMSAAIADNKIPNAKPLLVFEGVQLASYSFSVTARGLVGQDVTFVCKRAKDEGSTA
tara:strand:- start:209 stop:694 length:486 start_codon:yes stop_codon:yes gene_type:complete